jgi:hypothetical protein
MIPLNTSPAPAVARVDGASALTIASPSGAALTVSLPLRTMTAPLRRAEKGDGQNGAYGSQTLAGITLHPAWYVDGNDWYATASSGSQSFSGRWHERPGEP